MSRLVREGIVCRRERQTATQKETEKQYCSFSSLSSAFPLSPPLLSVSVCAPGLSSLSVSSEILRDTERERQRATEVLQRCAIGMKTLEDLLFLLAHEVGDRDRGLLRDRETQIEREIQTDREETDWIRHLTSLWLLLSPQHFLSEIFLPYFLSWSQHQQHSPSLSASASVSASLLLETEVKIKGCIRTSFVSFLPPLLILLYYCQRETEKDRDREKEREVTEMEMEIDRYRDQSDTNTVLDIEIQTESDTQIKTKKEIQHQNSFSLCFWRSLLFSPTSCSPSLLSVSVVQRGLSVLKREKIGAYYEYTRGLFQARRILREEVVRTEEILDVLSTT